MSGGHYDYFCWKLDSFIQELRVDDNPRRKAFRDLLEHVSRCCKAVEWVDSGDYGQEQEDEAFDKLFKSFDSPEIIEKAFKYDSLMKTLEQYRK